MGTEIEIMREVYERFDEERYRVGEDIFRGVALDLSPARLMEEALEEQVDGKFYMVMALRQLLPMSGRLRIFVCGAYTDSPARVDENILAARKATAAILNRGHFPLCPHTLFASFERDYPEIEYETYLEWSLAWLPLCHGIYLLPFWQKSEGAKRELALAARLELSVYYSIEDIPAVEEVREKYQRFGSELRDSAPNVAR